jgi:hypothetical protein
MTVNNIVISGIIIDKELGEDKQPTILTIKPVYKDRKGEIVTSEQEVKVKVYLKTLKEEVAEYNTVITLQGKLKLDEKEKGNYNDYLVIEANRVVDARVPICSCTIIGSIGNIKINERNDNLMEFQISKKDFGDDHWQNYNCTAWYQLKTRLEKTIDKMGDIDKSTVVVYGVPEFRTFKRKDDSMGQTFTVNVEDFDIVKFPENKESNMMKSTTRQKKAVADDIEF